MAKRTIEDVMMDIEDFLAGCKSAGFSSNKIAVPKDEFEDLFGELKVKLPAEIDRCKKIMRNKEAILMNARKEADTLLAEANVTAQQLIAETTIVQQANQQAYDTVEMAKAQANEIVANAVAQANEIRLGSMQYTNDIMMGIRNYVEATMNAERANYENLIQVLNNELMNANANIEEVQTQIVEFTGDPGSVTQAPVMKAASDTHTKEEPKSRVSVAKKVRQAVGVKEEKPENVKPKLDIPDFISSGEAVVPNETPLEVSVMQETAPALDPMQGDLDVESGIVGTVGVAPSHNDMSSDGTEKKVKKKIIKKRNPVIHTPQTAQEAVAKTVEAANANKTEKTIYKANGEQAREVPPMEGKVKRGPRVSSGKVEEAAATTEETVSVGAIDDLSMDKKY
ncbi:MAG: hypothetical protein ACI4F4_04245 [Lachnospiraceae bacterium]